MLLFSRLYDVLSSTIKACLWAAGVNRAGSLKGSEFKVQLGTMHNFGEKQASNGGQD